MVRIEAKANGTRLGSVEMNVEDGEEGMATYGGMTEVVKKSPSLQARALTDIRWIWSFRFC